MDESRPYLGQCAFCQAGLLRFSHCVTCDALVVLCDECELMWADLSDLSADANLSSDSQFPQCPSCGDPTARFEQASLEELEERGLQSLVEGESV